MTCAGPCFAATPTHGRPTMNRICVSTRSLRPSSFLKTAPRASKRSSSRRNSADTFVSVDSVISTLLSRVARLPRFNLGRGVEQEDDVKEQAVPDEDEKQRLR